MQLTRRAGCWVLLGAGSFCKFVQCFPRSSNGAVVRHVYCSIASKHEIVIVGPDDNLRSKIVCVCMPAIALSTENPGHKRIRILLWFVE